MARKTVVIITTGGTIAMSNVGSGAVPALSGRELAAMLPLSLSTAVHVHVEEFSNLPSGHLTPAHLWGLRGLVETQLAQPNVCGVVITHGTDTMEETAYLLDLTVASKKPIILTGAMRTVGELGYDGGANLVDAVRVALAPEAVGRGAMIVMSGEVHAARYVTKAHSTMVQAFDSPGWGPMGRIYPDALFWAWAPEREVLVATGLEPEVHLVKVALGSSPTIIQALVAHNVRGIVIEGLGGGRVPPWWLDALEAAVAQGVVVLVVGRTGSGRATDHYGYRGAHHDLVARGARFAHEVSGLKARIRLMVELGRGAPGEGN